MHLILSESSEISIIKFGQQIITLNCRTRSQGNRVGKQLLIREDAMALDHEKAAKR